LRVARCFERRVRSISQQSHPFVGMLESPQMVRRFGLENVTGFQAALRDAVPWFAAAPASELAGYRQGVPEFRLLPCVLDSRQRQVVAS